MIRSILFLSLVLGVSTAAVGCSAGAGPEGSESEFGDTGFSEDTGNLTEELGEPGCGTVACAGPHCLTIGSPACGGQALVLSPNPAYGTVSCPNQFMSRTLNVLPGGTTTPTFAWSGQPLTAANCASARVELGVYRKAVAAAPPTLIHSGVYTGVMVGGVCKFSGPAIPNVANSLEVRVAAKATFNNVKQLIRVGLKRTCP